jgi:uncharacterized membrane protein YedE/YeeE
VKRGLLAYVAGLVFSLGLGLSGMTQPAKVIGFLDFAGRWDPSLLVVMAGAVGVYAVGSRLVLRRPRPVLDTRFHVPPLVRVEPKELLGAAVFGVGWGLGGYCPGPAIVSMATGAAPVFVFVAAMVAGMAGHDALTRLRRASENTASARPLSRAA